MNRSELLFLYDITDANPNGDPLDDNKPRLDEENEINLVTDVRLKRTIRDYLKDYKNEEIFIKEKRDKDGNLQDAKQRALDFANNEEFESFEEAKKQMKNKITEDCIDVRLFGATVPIEVKVKSKNKKESGSITLTGPVQFRMGRSLHKVEINHIKGTGAFASGSGKDQKTFREEYILPYSLISFYGVINENAAEETNMAEEDISLLIEGIWNGTKNLISRSKFGQVPRLLLQIEYEDNYFIGDLNNKISLSHDFDDEKKLRSINDCQIDISHLMENIEEDKDNIVKINYKFDNNISFKDFESIEDLLEAIKNLGIEIVEIGL
ncbi:CRISPR-associated protein, Csh2 family [Methanobrevibacter olleyae]|uniref:CRISPR-associated protein, Csh2 family n=1 Tax=Methanobrevibacter olleyae TaxID=294671 RepID=A0A1I4K7P2_METOL|nr:type I-B CRISPR-associated protein Cas7/Csh2 [Methanobrevibacter olleyae]SFL74591.1 CRISPR-associated protein, Csh2 family [Methanobrevibacter olleyae]